MRIDTAAMASLWLPEKSQFAGNGAEKSNVLLRHLKKLVEDDADKPIFRLDDVARARNTPPPENRTPSQYFRPLSNVKSTL